MLAVGYGDAGAQGGGVKRRFRKLILCYPRFDGGGFMDFKAFADTDGKMRKQRAWDCCFLMD